MALGKCRECNSSVSSRAKSCPSCGAPVKHGIDPGRGLLIVGGVSVALYFISTNNSGVSHKTSSEVEYQQNYKLIAVAKRNVESRLKDPDSAKFGVSWSNRINGSDEFVCGSVNAKNGFGGYVGARNFLFLEKQGVFIDDGGAEFSDTWQSLCDRTN